VMLTGDHAATANAVARTLGIDEVIADVRPDHKRDVVNCGAGQDSATVDRFDRAVGCERVIVR